MANRSSRDPGQLATFDATGAISSDVPSYAVYTGQASEALASVAGSLANQLGQLAVQARIRERTEDGLAYGKRMGEPFLQQQAAMGAADKAPEVISQDEASARTFLRGRTDKDASHIDGMKGAFAGKLARLLQSAPADIKEGLGVYSGFRSVERQTELWQQALKKYGSAEAARKWVAPPGRSNHNHGNAADLSYNGASLKHAPAHVVSWLHENAGAFGLAFPLSNENWHIEDIEARGGKRRVAAEGYAAKPLSMEPLALRHDGTIGGEAFDAAALSAWSWRMQEGVHTEVFAAQQAHQDDPAGFAAAAEAVRAKYAAELPNDPKAIEAFDQAFQRNARAYGMNIAARHEANLRQEQQASFASGMSAMSVDLERQAQLLGANPRGDAILSERVAAMQRAVDGAYGQNIITAGQAEEYKQNMALTAARGRVQGVFESLPTPEEKQAYATGLLDEWAKNEGPLKALPRATVKALSNTLFSEAERLRNAAGSASKAERSRVKALIKDDLASMETTGVGLTDLTEAHVRETLGADAADAWGAERDLATRAFQATAGLEGAGADEIVARIDALAPKPGEAGFADQEKIFAAAGKRAETVLKERAKDPLGQAAAAGLIDLQPIETLTPETISQSLQARVAQRQVVADAYGFQPPMFTPGEAAALKAQMLSADPAVQTATMTQLDFLAGSDGLLAVKQQLGNDAVTRLQDWQGRLRYMSAEEMTNWLKEKADPKWQEIVQPLVKKGQQEARKDAFADIVDKLDDNWIFDVRGPVDLGTKNMLMSDYAMLVGERYASVEDMGKAKEQAVERLRKVWGTSQAFGESGGRLMLYPPEMHYPAIGNSQQYIADEVAEIAKARGVTAENLSLVSDAKTEAAVDRGELPGYLISVTDPETGLDELATDEKGRPLRHFFDAQGAQAGAMRRAGGRRDRLKQHERVREILRRDGIPGEK